MGGGGQKSPIFSVITKWMPPMNLEKNVREKMKRQYKLSQSKSSTPVIWGHFVETSAQQYDAPTES